LNDLPVQLAKFEIPIRELTTWDDAQRKGNVLRNWVTDHLAVKPLQSPSAIAEALKLSGIENLWDRIAPNQGHRRALLDEFDKLVKRRNQISHEGDREQSRRSGKRLRPISRKAVKAWIHYVEDLVAKVEAAFP
jgi:hypothetical protein